VSEFILEEYEDDEIPPPSSDEHEALCPCYGVGCSFACLSCLCGAAPGREKEGQDGMD
jgi:hypothetical protein